MKRKLFLVLLVLVIFLTGCDTYAMFDRYPWDRAEQWYCEEIDLTITYTYREDGSLLGSGTLPWVWNGQTYYNMNISFGPGYFAFDTPDETHVSTDGTIKAKVHLSGSWEYQGKKLILTISEDNLFGGEFAELVFIPQHVIKR